MSPSEVAYLARRLDDIHKEIEEVQRLARETNGRIKELEIWRARMQGVASSARILWLVIGGITSAAIIEIFFR
jgi:hypothetical protein